jgi:hypothetical protein
MQNKVFKGTGKSVIPGKVVQMKPEYTNLEKRVGSNSHENTNLFFTVLTNPKAIVKNGHEILVVDLLASDSSVMTDIPLEILETVV